LGGQSTYKGTTPAKGGYIEIGTPSRMYGLPDEGHGSYTAELNANRLSSLYQTIATVPGKIYEWSLDYGTRSRDVQASIATMRLAVVIGDALDGKADYNAGTTDRYLSDIYPYGQNDSSYFYDIVGRIANPSSAPDGVHTVDYNGSTYYVYLATIDNTAAADQRGKWFPHSGAYTVPAGQGETVFGFVGMSFNSSGGSVANTSGNNLDNIVFASATSLNATQDASYTGETSLSTPTKAGFSYALAELRGSSVNELVAQEASYDADGQGTKAQVSITPTLGLGTGGWYSTDSNTGTGGTAFGEGGIITFKNLTPGKTYRIIGIPTLAINTSLHTNEGPAGVLDEGYYKDARIMPVASGSEESLPVWEMELYTDNTHAKRVRLTLKNTNASAQYALLSDEGGAPGLTALSKPPTPWVSAQSGSVVFEGLIPAQDYWLVARPSGYVEITYKDAAYDAQGELVALKISMPPLDVIDIDPANVQRAPGGTEIVVQGGFLGQDTYEIALADPLSGRIISSPYSWDEQVSFQGLNPALSYQVICRLKGSSWLKGVRVLPFPDTLIIDYANAAIKSLNAQNGFIPVGTEYALSAADISQSWLIGTSDTWVQGTDSSYLELAETCALPSFLDSTNIFDALDELNAPFATLSYRLSAPRNLSGAFVAPSLSLYVPARQSAPVGDTGNLSDAFALDVVAEALHTGSSALEYKQGPKTSSFAYAPLSPNSNVSFASLGWGEAAPYTITLRFPAIDTGVSYTSAFPSAETEVTLSARPGAPLGLSGEFVDNGDPAQGITISGLSPNTAYQYKQGESSWQDFTPTGSSHVLPYVEGNGGNYAIRFAAALAAPASFPAMVSSPLNIAALNLGALVYGAIDTTQKPIVISNIVSSAISLDPEALVLSGAGSEYFTLTPPSSAHQIPGASGGSVGRDESWTIAPKGAILAGAYALDLTLSYTYNDKPYATSAFVYLTVNKADWDISSLQIFAYSVTDESFTLSVEGVPKEAYVSWRLGSGAYSDVPDKVDAQGKASHAFYALQPATTYAVRLRLEADANHNVASTFELTTISTAQKTPDITSLLRIDYSAETLLFNMPLPDNTTQDDYLIKVGTTELSHLFSLSDIASTDFVITAQREVRPPYAASALSTLSVTGRSLAPSLSDITTTPASDDTTADGSIKLSGAFQYRASKNGADPASGWMSASEVAERLVAGRYELRRGPSASAFGSHITQVQVLSSKPVISLRTKTYLKDSSFILPSYIITPQSWMRSTDPLREGSFERAYLASPLTLPALTELTSTSHVFKGWYDTAELSGSALTQTPHEASLVSHEYFARWVARPVIETLGGSVPVIDNASASQGLKIATPVKLSARLSADKNTFALSDVVLLGQSSVSGKQATLYSDADFTTEITSLPLLWADDDTYPARAWLKTTSSDDDETTIYYELELHTTRSVHFSVTQQGGRAAAQPGDLDVKTTTALKLEFDEPVSGLSAEQIHVSGTQGNSAGDVKTGALTSFGGKIWTLMLDEVALSGDIDVVIDDWAGFALDDNTKTVRVYRDAVAPTSVISIQQNLFQSFISTLTFGLFFKDEAHLRIDAQDSGDGVLTVEYLKRSSSSADETLAALTQEEALVAQGWTAYPQETNGVTVDTAQKFIIYARVTDKAGNISVIGSDGAVVYNLSKAVSSDKLTYTKLSLTDLLATFDLKGNTIAEVVLTADGISDTTLVPTTDYTVLGNVLTLKGTWLDTLAAYPQGAQGENSCTYTLYVGWNPLGEDASKLDSSAFGVSTPLPTPLTLTVQKATPVLELKAEPVLTARHDAPLTLRAVVSGISTNVPQGRVYFYKNSQEEENILGGGYKDLESASSVGASSQRALLSLTKLDVGTYTFLAHYSGDAIYASGDFPGIMGYSITPASQNTPSITEIGQTSPLSSLTKAREALTFDLEAKGAEEGAGGYVWASSDESVATVSPLDSAQNNDKVRVTLKKAGATTISLYRAGSSNYFDSASSFLTLTVQEETTPPVPADTGALSVAPNTLEETSFRLTWTKATDTFSDADALTYFIYRSSSNNIATPDQCQTNGTLINTGGTKDIDAFTVEGLSPSTAYYVNVVVKDEAGNAAAYMPFRIVTPTTVCLISALQQGGKNGRANTTGILITFDKAVSGLSQANTSVIQISGQATQNGQAQLAPNPSNDNKEDGVVWLVPIRPTQNDASATVSVSAWDVSATGHSYRVLNDVTSQAATVYKEVKEDTPNASIDYVNRSLKGFVPNTTYQFALKPAPGTEPAFGDKIVADKDGIYPTIPFSARGQDILIKRVGTGAEAQASVSGTLDSEPQTLAIPHRPDTPVLSVTQPNEDANETTGSVTVTGVAISGVSAETKIIYEYTTRDTFLTNVGGTADNYDPSLWEEAGTAKAGETFSVSNLEPGAYYLRVKASQTDAYFASVAKLFHIGSALDALEGYSVENPGTPGKTSEDTTPDVLAWKLLAASGQTISQATLVDEDDNPIDPADAQFEIFSRTDGTDTNYFLIPKPGLLRGTYVARALLVHNDSSKAVREIDFNVHPKAKIASATASSSAGTDALTDTLTLEFTYPVALFYDQVIIAGAAIKDADATDFLDDRSGTSSPDGFTTYTVALSPSLVYKTGDEISVTIKLDVHDRTFVYQIEKELSGTSFIVPDTSPQVVIPRAIDKAYCLKPLPGATTGIIQFDLTTTSSPVASQTSLPPTSIEWVYTDADPCPVLLEDKEGKASVVAVYSIEETKTSLGYTTFRIFIAVQAEGSIYLSAPGIGITDKTEVTGLKKTSFALSDAGYFLDGTGRDYHTTLDAFQKLPEVDAADAYIAPGLTLPTNLELDAVQSVKLWLQRPGDTEPLELTQDKDYELVQGLGTQFIFTNSGATTPITKQLALSLLPDWTRANGAYRLLALVQIKAKDASNNDVINNLALQAAFSVKDITATYALTLSDDTGAHSSSLSKASSAHGIPAHTLVAYGAFAKGAEVTLQAANPDTGYKFSHWEQVSGPDPAVVLPKSPTGTFTMPDAATEIRARYTDGTSPQTKAYRSKDFTELTSNTWLNKDDTITFVATDFDVTKGDTTGEVTSTTYTIDNGEEQIYDSPFKFADTTQEGLHLVRFWSKDASGNKEEERVLELGYDTQAPRVTLLIRGRDYTEFMAPSSFTRFYKGDVIGEIKSADTDGTNSNQGSLDTVALSVASGIKEIAYLTSAVAYTSEAALAATATPWVKDTHFTLTTDEKYYVYARAIDYAGNVTYVASEGLVRYSDSAYTGPEATHTKTSSTQLSLSLTLNANTTAQVAYQAQGQDTSIALIKDSDYTLSGTTLSLAPSWLNTLNAASYFLKLTFNPLGEPYTPNEGNDAPAFVSIPLVVFKASPALSFSATSVDTTYDTPTTLEATVTGTSGFLPTGKVSFFDGATQIEDEVELVEEGGVVKARLEAWLSAGAHELSACYSGDSTYEPSQSTKSNWAVTKANQGSLTLHESSDGPVLVSRDTTYGDEAFSVIVKGAKGEGGFVWSSSDEAIAHVDAQSGLIRPVAQGSCVISVYNKGDDNYNDSPAVSLRLTVAYRDVTLRAYVKDKPYDETTTAEISSCAIENLARGDENALYIKQGTARFIDASVGTGKMVTFDDFGITGSKLANYRLLAQPLATTATIYKATPVWTTPATALSIVYGAPLSSSYLTARVSGANDSELEGTLQWDFDTSVIPGDDAQSEQDGLKTSYSYPARFVPDNSNYEVLSTSVEVSVTKALPSLLATAHASALFAATSALPQSLADSHITSDVVFDKGGIQRSVKGTWVWDDEKNAASGLGASALEIFFAAPGTYSPWALFIPDDARLETLSVQASLEVFSPKTEIVTLPTIRGAVYGSTLDEALFLGGEVKAISADDVTGTQQDITSRGTWRWEVPKTPVTSQSGTQSATAVFIPDEEARLEVASPAPSGYVKAFTQITFEVSPFVPVPLQSEVPTLQPINFGEPLSALNLSRSGLSFAGVSSFGQDELIGEIKWQDSSVIPGQAQQGADGFGGLVRESGRFLAQVTFIPDAWRYNKAYAPYTFEVEVPVTLSYQTQSQLEKSVREAEAIHATIISPAKENYDALATSRFELARKALEELILAAETDVDKTIPQADAERIYEEFEQATLALTHDHPVLAHSATEPILDKGTAVIVAIKGSFEHVVSVTLDKRPLVLKATSSPTLFSLELNAEAIGTLSKGSAVVSLFSSYVNSLSDGIYTIEVFFSDVYGKGSNSATFTVAHSKTSVVNNTPSPSENTSPTAVTGTTGTTGTTSTTGTTNSEGEGDTSTDATATRANNSTDALSEGGVLSGTGSAASNVIFETPDSPDTSNLLYLALFVFALVVLSAIALVIYLASRSLQKRRQK
jgi:hypothetical protein